MPPATSAVTTETKKILEAIKGLSDRLDTASTITAVALAEKDKLLIAQAQLRIDPVLSRLDTIEANTKGIENQLITLNGTVRVHDKDIIVLNTCWKEQVQPALGKLVDLRIEFAKWAAAGGGLGLIGFAGFSVFKLAGWL